MRSKYINLLLAVTGALLLWAAWPTSPFTFLIFIAWLPLFFVADNTKSWKKFLGYTYLHMLLWNLLTTWWVALSSIPGGLGAFFANSLIMCIPWLLYFFTKKYVGAALSVFALIAYWITYEYIHHNWDLSWPWLTLGNAFATKTSWVQWYEYTGTTGGGLWVWLANGLLFLAIRLYTLKGRSTLYFTYIAALAVVLCAPVIISFFIVQKQLTLHHNKYNIIAVQPNIDPWDEKFVAGKQEAQLQKMVALSQQQVDENTALVVWPETAIPFYNVDETRLTENFLLLPVWNFVKHNPHLNLLSGLEGIRSFAEKKTRYSKPFSQGEGYYESYNSAALFDSSSVQIYHKSKLVPGVEVLPGFLHFMASAFEKFGGTSGGYARDTAAKVLRTTNHTFNITPAVCYESIYSDYLTHFNRQGSDVICIITNDGWWQNTQGHKQHMNYARLRAIESRKWVVRSANTGISCFIDPNGNIVQQLGWNKQGALKQTVGAFVTTTFYTKHGDWMSTIFVWAAGLVLLITVYKIVMYKKAA